MTDGIMQSINLDVKAKDDRMQDAFKDLEVLMVRAGEMVRSPFFSRQSSRFWPEGSANETGKISSIPLIPTPPNPPKFPGRNAPTNIPSPARTPHASPHTRYGPRRPSLPRGASQRIGDIISG
jgi:hypothetical protein